MYPPIVIDLRLFTWSENKSTPKLIEEEHKGLHKNSIAHIHVDGSRG